MDLVCKFVNMMFLDTIYIMRISKRFEFGLIAAIYLASYYKVRAVSKKEIAENENIPYKYLEIVMKLLKNSGIIESKAGAGGGYMLKINPSAITALELFNILEGNISFENSNQKTTYVYSKLKSAIVNTLKSINLDKLKRMTVSDEYYI